MKAIIGHILRNRLAQCCLFVVVLFVFPKLSFAPPSGQRGRPGPAAPAGKVPGPAIKNPSSQHPRPGPQKKARPKPPLHKKNNKPHPKLTKNKTPLRKTRHKHPISRPKYWHPYYVSTPGSTTTVWRNIGYSYYVGGTDYVNVPPSEQSDEQADESEPIISTADDNPINNKYIQIMELSELIHQWRSMNESPELHKRITKIKDSDIVSEIKEENRKFDQATRSAMITLAKGQSAEPQLEAAGLHFEKLIEFVESLPEPADG